MSMRDDYLSSLAEQIENIEYLLMALRHDKPPNSSWDDLLRVIHSVKGAAGSLGVNFIGTVCHQFETYLSATGPTKINLDLCLQLIDLLFEYINHCLEGKNIANDILFNKKLEAIIPSKKTADFKILIVENTQAMSEYYAKTLSEKFMVTITYEKTGIRAFARLIKEDYDALLTSVYVGELDGPSLISAVKVCRGPNRNIPTLLITSDQNKAISGTGFDSDFVLKKSQNLHNDLLVYFEDIFNKRFFIGAIAKNDRGELKKILCVDDDELIRGLVKIGLKKLLPLPEVQFAESGKNALAKLENYHPDLIIMDVMMPEMTGPETLNQIRLDKLTRAIPVIFLTGQHEKAEINALLELGVLGVIRKPFDNKKLAGYIEAIWHRKC